MHNTKLRKSEFKKLFLLAFELMSKKTKSNLNDVISSSRQTEIAWRSMMSEALAAEVKLILMTPTPDLKEDLLNENKALESHSDLIIKLGKEYQIPVVDVYSSFRELKLQGKDISEYMSPGNHPNEQGHQVVLTEIVNELFSEINMN